MAAWNVIFKPILGCMTVCLQEHNRQDLAECLPRYMMFRIRWGMLQPPERDDVSDCERMHYNP